MNKIHIAPTKDQTRLIEKLCDELGLPEVFPKTKQDARSVISYLLLRVKQNDIDTGYVRSHGEFVPEDDNDPNYNPYEDPHDMAYWGYDPMDWGDN